MTPPLSEELLAKIIGNLGLPSAYTIAEIRRIDASAYEVRCNIYALCNVSQVSQAFHRIAEPVLYRVYPGSLEGFVNNRLYLAALLARPGRAQLVKEAVVENHDVYPGLPSVWIPWHTTYHQAWVKDPFHVAKPSRSKICPEELYVEVSPELRGMVRAKIMIESFAAFMIEQLDSGHPDAVLAALILTCTELEAMDVTLNKMFSRSILARAMYNPFDIASGLSHCNRQDPPLLHEVFDIGGSRFRRLRSLDIRGDGQNVYTSIGPLFELPQLKSVTTHRLHSLGSLAHDKHAAVGGRNIKSLNWPGLSTVRLQHCSLNFREVNQLLDIAPSLRTLEITWGSQASICRHGELGDPLRSRGQKLEHLILDSRRSGWGLTWPANAARPFEYEESLSQLIGSLKDLTSLKSLMANEKLLLGPVREKCISTRPVPAQINLLTTSLMDTLPDGLEEFTLLGSLQPGSGPLLQNHAAREVDWLLRSDYFHPLRLVQIHGYKDRTNNASQEEWNYYTVDDGEHVFHTYRK